jgi:tetratricopeptide (TPR) repeat protein
MQPSHKAALVARSQCHLKLGDAASALKDAEASFDKNSKVTFVRGLVQYAEALYNLGSFEKALIAFHRGFRVRRDMEGFRIGVQKCQEAIRIAIGDQSATQIEDLDEILPLIEEMEAMKNRKLTVDYEHRITTINFILEYIYREERPLLHSPWDGRGGLPTKPGSETEAALKGTCSMGGT